MTPLGKVSEKTQERALKLASGAHKLGLTLRTIKFNPLDDFLSFWLANDASWVVIFVTSTSFLVEHWTIEDDSIEPTITYYIVSNLANLLRKLRSMDFEDFSDHYEDTTDGLGQICPSGID